MATNHGFADGNKRTAYLLLLRILEGSGYGLRETSSLDDENDLEHLILDMTTRFLDEEEVGAWIKKRLFRL